jgi:hypothetical protein
MAVTGEQVGGSECLPGVAVRDRPSMSLRGAMLVEKRLHSHGTVARQALPVHSGLGRR